MKVELSKKYFEKEFLLENLKKHDYNIDQMAQELGIIKTNNRIKTTVWFTIVNIR